MMLTVPDYTGLGEVFVEAANELGYPRADLNGNFTEGLQKILIIKNEANERRCLR
jgi:hypothetical protein